MHVVPCFLSWDMASVCFYRTLLSSLRKPDPCPYETAMKRLGVRPERCIAFEASRDRAETGAEVPTQTTQTLLSLLSPLRRTRPPEPDRPWQLGSTPWESCRARTAASFPSEPPCGRCEDPEKLRAAGCAEVVQSFDDEQLWQLLSLASCSREYSKRDWEKLSSGGK